MKILRIILLQCKFVVVALLNFTKDFFSISFAQSLALDVWNKGSCNIFNSQTMSIFPYRKIFTGEKFYRQFWLLPRQ